MVELRACRPAEARLPAFAEAHFLDLEAVVFDAGILVRLHPA